MTREQRRASLVYKKVKPYAPKEEPHAQDDKLHTDTKDDKFRKSYGSIALRFPALLRSAGLVQALAFVQARGKDEHKKFIEDFTEVLVKLDKISLTESTPYETYFKNARKAELSAYMRMTREALAVADWFKRFAQSVLKVEPGEED